MVFLIITDNEFYDADCVLSIEGQTNTRMSRLGSLPPLPTEVSSDKQTLNMSSFFFLLGGGELTCLVLISLLTLR